MDEKTGKVNDFLHELFQQVGSKEIPQISMYDVGANIGLDKDKAAALAEELMIDDLVELKTLAGEIGITEAGLELLQRNGLIAGRVTTSHTLSGEVVLTEGDRQVIEEILAAIRQALTQNSTDYEVIEEAIIDMKTIEVQLLSPQPKTAVVLAVFSSLKNLLRRINGEEIITEFDAVFARL